MEHKLTIDIKPDSNKKKILICDGFSEHNKLKIPRISSFSTVPLNPHPPYYVKHAIWYVQG
jgi:hypothetical protein